jgi:hypothetical protein
MTYSGSLVNVPREEKKRVLAVKVMKRRLKNKV